MDNTEIVKIADPNDFSWIKVKKHVDDESKTFQERLYILEEHHVKETEFLLNKCRELANIIQNEC